MNNAGFDRREVLTMTAAGMLTAAAGPLPANWTPPKPSRELHVPIPGGKLYVRVNGKLDSGKPPLVMVHGGPGGSHAAFIPALALADERAVILYDQLDCGLSDRPNDPANWTVLRFVSELSAIRDALEIERLHLLGHSWGATIALEYAARTKSLASVVFQGPLISTPRWVADAALLRKRLPSDVQAVLTACEGAAPPSAAACQAATDVFYKQYWRREPVPAWQAAYEKSIPPLNQALYQSMWGPNEFVCTGTLKAYDGTPILPRVRAPALFLTGEFDEGTPAAAADFAKLTPKGEVAVIPGAGHRIQTDRTEAYNSTLRTWLRRFDG